MMSRAVLMILAVALFLSEAGIAQEKQVPAKFKRRRFLRRVRGAD